MTISLFLRALAAGAFLLLAAPMSTCRRQPAFTRRRCFGRPGAGQGRQVQRGADCSATAGRRPHGRGERALPHRPGSDRRIAAARSCRRRAGGAADEAIASLRAVLINRPDLVRVRLELARAFFLKGEDSLARGHFERVLAGKPPAPVVANVQRFLAEIRARRRWTMYLGAAMSPDSNIGGASDEQIIYINDLPFRRDAEELTTSGIGVSVWTGGEYQHPLGDRLRLRLGGDLSRQDYGGRKFDQTFVSVHAGPRWLVDKDTDVSLVASARRRWTGTAPSYDDLGVRVEAGRRLTPRIRVSGRASWYRRDYRTRDFLDGPVLDFSLSGSWVILPILRADGAAGYAHERPRSETWRNASRWLRLGASVALPLGFTVGGSGELRWTDYEGNWFPFTRDGVPREDRTRILRATVHNRAFTLFGFSPQLVVTNEARDTNAQLYDYKRTRAELRAVRQF